MGNARLIIFICCFFSGVVLSMDLRPNDLKITLEIDQKSSSSKAIIPLRLRIENVSNHQGNILIPYGQNKGKSLFQLRIFRLDSMENYTLLYTSPVELNMDTSKYVATDGFWQLQPGEKFIQPFFLNDVKNAKTRVESSYQLPELQDGRYAFQFLYMPEHSAFFKYAFIKDDNEDPIPEDYVDGYPDHFRWEGSMASNFVEVFVTNETENVQHAEGDHCRLCRKIANEKWTFVRRKWDKLYKKGNHSAILWVYDGPQAVLMSLPSFASFTVIVQSDSGINYLSFTYQLGKIYKFRSRLAWVFYAVGFRRPPFETSKVRWQKLIQVKQL